MKIAIFHLLVFTCLVIFNCSEDDSEDNPQDLTVQQQVENFVTPELIQSLQNLGFTFRDGDETPDISGDFKFTPFELKATNVENDSPLGTIFNDTNISFSNLNSQAREFNFAGSEANGSTYSNITDTFYSGSGNSFSAYVKFTNNIGDAMAETLIAISGNISENGIEDAEFAILILDYMGNTNVFIANG